jgi:hypothetical protein
VSPTGAAIAAVVALMLFWRGNWRKPTILVAVIAAAGLGGSGLVGSLAVKVVAASDSLSSSVSTQAFGVDMPYLIPLALVIFVVLDLRRGASPTNITLLAAVVLVWTMGSLGGPGGDAVQVAVNTIAEWGSKAFEAAVQAKQTGGR